MNRHVHYKSLLIGMVLLLVGHSISAQERKARNVLLICIDDLRPAIGAFGDEYAITPNIDLLAKEALVFKNAYAQQSICNPSRASMLTGLRPSTTQIFDIKTELRDKLPDVITLPQMFKQNGFFSAGFGKVFHNHLDDPKSWSKKLFFPKGLRKWKTKENQEMADLNGLGPSMEFISGAESPYKDQLFNGAMIEQLRNLDGRPFFLAIGYVRPHLPFVAPKKYLDLYKDIAPEQALMTRFPDFSPAIAHTNSEELRKYSDIPETGDLTEETKLSLTKAYYACTSYIDDLIGQIIAELKEQNLYDDTMIILWGDHGFKLGEFGQWAKHTNYDIDTRVPLIIKGVNGETGIREEIVESTDIFTTLANYFEMTPVQQLEGADLFNINESISSNFALSFDTHSSEKRLVTSIRTARYRYVIWPQGDQELYDYSNWGERVNVANDRAYAMISQFFSDFIISMQYESVKTINIDDLKIDYFSFTVGYVSSDQAINVEIISDDVINGKIASIRVFNMNGSLLYDEKLAVPDHSYSLELENPNSGIYYVVVENLNGRRLGKKLAITN